MATGSFVAYYRVSTAEQGRSGLGLEAQQSAVRGYLNGGKWDLVAEFTEVESGKRSDRPQLAAALAACRRHRACLVVAKLDRLARNVAFTSALMEAGVEFVAVDMPAANRLVIHIMSAMAEHEREAISARTKAALAAAKARGVKLGNPRLAECRNMDTRSATAARAAARARADDDLRSIVADASACGETSIRAVMEWLNTSMVPSPTGGPEWSYSSARRLLQRLEKSA